ncbi:lipopolysaccharide transport periplasmic protein LptA [Marinobacter sp. X15-166B]|uniref:lipopolysaccharide transport periplasmic protein LptA n=1 Tax=Marinobacter sp. X15-166B TaxID=1897620 RepID=UPI00085C9570|nr:lipopolysaccharide transport periplasmic protein LptA [Marinobacter sp. X15-166B]OEY65202.1 lipopolysaccharide transport periplasmic protein LptA [Marinobacter sp. X15-166B]
MSLHNKGTIPALSAWMAAALLAVTPAHGFDLQSGEPITINADSGRMDDTRGIATYSGDVVVTQGTTRLSADRVMLYRDEGELSRIEASGRPARYQQPTEAGKGETDAQALSITYASRDGLLILEQEAVIKQDGNLFRGDIIHYDTAQRVVTAEGTTREDNSKGRIEIIIQPRPQN